MQAALNAMYHPDATPFNDVTALKHGREQAMRYRERYTGAPPHASSMHMSAHGNWTPTVLNIRALDWLQEHYKGGTR